MAVDHEAIYLQVEDAIRRKLHICGRYRTPMGGISYEYPVAIEEGNIILRDGDCGLAKGTREITTDDWHRLTQGGQYLYRRVGMWDFELADDPAADLVAYAHRSPSAVGHELYRARKKLEVYEDLLKAARMFAELLQRLFPDAYTPPSDRDTEGQT